MTNSQELVISRLIEIAADDIETNKLFEKIAGMLAKFDTETVTIYPRINSFELRKNFRGLTEYLTTAKNLTDAKIKKEHYLITGDIL